MLTCVPAVTFDDEVTAPPKIRAAQPIKRVCPLQVELFWVSSTSRIMLSGILTREAPRATWYQGSRWTPVKLLFFVNRYGTLLLVGFAVFCQ